MKTITPASVTGKRESATAGTVAEAALQVILEDLTLGQATEMARAGKFAEAERLIREANGEAAITPSQLDLLARIRCQQGRFAEAEAFWKMALHLDEDNQSYRAGLRQIARSQRRPAWLASLSLFLTGALVIASIVIAALLIRSYLKASRDADKAEARNDASSQASTNTASTGQPAASSSDVPGAEKTGERAEKTTAIDVNLSGLTQQKDGSRQVLVFDAGLFAKGTALTPEAKRLLQVLGKRLESDAERLDISIVGHTDNSAMRPGSAFADQLSLGMSRAIAVFNYLKWHTRLPVTSLSVRSFGDSRPPYPNDTYENRARNRTVTLYLSEK